MVGDTRSNWSPLAHPVFRALWIASTACSAIATRHFIAPAIRRSVDAAVRAVEHRTGCG
jgi:hypothetical protein